MHYYKAKIQYAGTQYAGFQWQNGISTVQSEINKALSILLEGKFTTTAASRTDTGVHAADQLLKISASNSIDLSVFLEAFNKQLPPAIRCIHIELCEGTFRPAAAALSKEYRYFFTNQRQVSKEDSQFVANISNPLDIEAINICIRALKGKHDFCNFYSSGSNVKSTIRDIYLCELSEINPHDIFSDLGIFQIPQELFQCYQLKIEANGFLKQMIRHIVSALWMVGSKKLSVDEFINLLDGPQSEKQLWKVASPNGLFLYQINY